jgi:hypothetical protein
MTAEWAYTASPHTLLRTADQAHVPDDPANRDYQEFLEWEADGGVPDPYVPPPEPEPQPLRLEAHPRDDMDAATLQSVRAVTTAQVTPLLKRMAEVERWLAMRPGASP